MEKYYFTIAGISKKLQDENEADRMCRKIQEFLQFVGFEHADVCFSDEKYFKHEYNID